MDDPRHVLLSGNKLYAYAKFDGSRYRFNLPAGTSWEGLIAISPVYDEDLIEGTEWAVQSRFGPDKGRCRILRVLAKYQDDAPQEFRSVDFSRI